MFSSALYTFISDRHVTLICQWRTLIIDLTVHYIKLTFISGVNTIHLHHSISALLYLPYQFLK